MVVFSCLLVYGDRKTYMFTGAFKDITPDSVYNFWCEVGISAYHPDSNIIDYLVAMNTWDGCGRGLDGTFQDDYCKYGGPLYTVSDTIEGDATFYLLCLTGLWDNGEEPREFDVLVDEFSLVEYVEDGIRDIGTAIGGSAASLYNYPNPFSENTTITYTVSGNSDVRLTVYNLLGDEVAVLVNETKKEGTYNVEFDGSGLARSIYFCSLKINNKTITRRMIISE